jgi:hypothetical protein
MHFKLKTSYFLAPAVPAINCGLAASSCDQTSSALAAELAGQIIGGHDAITGQITRQRIQKAVGAFAREIYGTAGRKYSGAPEASPDVIS